MLAAAISSVSMDQPAIAIPLPVTMVKRCASSVAAHAVKPGVSGPQSAKMLQQGRRHTVESPRWAGYSKRCVEGRNAVTDVTLIGGAKPRLVVVEIVDNRRAKSCHRIRVQIANCAIWTQVSVLVDAE